jgi:trimeric autotransporter adhesin
MTRILLLLQLFFLIPHVCFSQGVGIGTTLPDSSAALDVVANNKGLLIPRMNTASINAIAKPANGLLVYDTQTNQLKVNRGDAVTPNFQPVASANVGWSLTGNSGTNAITQFIGTGDNQPLRFRVNNIQAGELHPFNGSISWGLRAGQSNTTGINNIAIGKDALKSNREGSGLVAIGDSALFHNDTGNPSSGLFANGNTAIGSKALFANTFGNNNTAAGRRALFSNTEGNLNSAYGESALRLNTTGGFNTAIGGAALANNTTGNFNTATGTNSLLFNTTGSHNTAAGVFSLTVNTTGNFNTAAGFRTLTSNTIGNSNTAFGSNALFFSQAGSHNTAMGDSSLFSNTSGNSNTAIGFRALSSSTTATGNTAVGFASLLENITGSSNVAIGFNALLNTDASNNTVIGFDAGSTVAFGSNNTLVGAGAGAFVNTLTNSVAIGKDARVTDNNQVRLGNTATTSIGGVVGFSNFSDGRYKKNIREDVKGLDFIMKLRPVTYHLDIAGLNKKLMVKSGADAYEKNNTIQSGFIAQEVQVAAEAIGYAFSGVDKPANENGLYGLRYAEFVVPLVKAIQEQQQMIVDLKKQNADLLKRVLALEKK